MVGRAIGSGLNILHGGISIGIVVLGGRLVRLGRKGQFRLLRRGLCAIGVAEELAVRHHVSPAFVQSTRCKHTLESVAGI